MTVVVPATDGPPSLVRCRAAIDAAHDGPDQVVVIESPRQLSASGARNLGAAQAASDILVFVDSDVEVHPDAFTRIREAFANSPELTAVFGSYDDAPAGRGRVSSFRNLLHHHVHHQGAGPAETFWAGLGAVRRQAFLDAGGFDADRFPHASVEDIELGDRLCRRGATIVLDPRIQGTHLKRWTLRSMVHTDFARRGVPWVALQVRGCRMSSTLNLGWRHRLSAVACVTMVVATVFRRPAVALGAVGSFVVLNRAFYRLLSRRNGPVDAVIGVGLHGLHHIVGVLAVPAGVVIALTHPSWRKAAPGTPTPTPGTDVLSRR